MYRGITHSMLKVICNWQVYYNMYTRVYYTYYLCVCLYLCVCACVCLGVTVEQVLNSNHKLKL